MDTLRILRWMVRAERRLRLLSPFIGPHEPFRSTFRRDPHSVYRRLQREAPVYFSPVLRSLLMLDPPATPECGAW